MKIPHPDHQTVSNLLLSLQDEEGSLLDSSVPDAAGSAEDMMPTQTGKPTTGSVANANVVMTFKFHGFSYGNLIKRAYMIYVLSEHRNLLNPTPYMGVHAIPTKVVLPDSDSNIDTFASSTCFCRCAWQKN